MVKRAQALVGKPSAAVTAQYGRDCSGLIKGLYRSVGLDVMEFAEPGENAVKSIFRYAESYGRIFEGGRPVPGDLVFFRDTWDVDGDGSFDDGLSHIGIVEAMDDNGTVSIIHRVSKGIVRYRMNLDNPWARDNGQGTRLNDYIRAAQARAKPRLTSELFSGYGTVLPVEPRFAAR